MADTPRYVITIAGVQHSLELVKQISSQANRVSINVEDIHAMDSPGYACPITPEAPQAALYGDVVFFKREGKYMVVLGLKTFLSFKSDGMKSIKGKLLSGPMLKRARVVIAPPSEPIQPSEPVVQEGPRAYVDTPERHHRPLSRVRSFSNGQERNDRYR